jgi:RNA polymerase sigma factor (TIGR02999 family)
MHEVTRILSAVEQGDPQAAEQLLPLVYHELRRLAAEKLRQEKPGQMLQATALVHEAYIRLVDVEKSQHWNSRGHFFAAAAEAMRRILVEAARRRQRTRHGGDFRRIPESQGVAAEPDDELVAVDEALRLLVVEDPQAAQVVNLRYFAGLSHEEVATTLDITVYRASQKWTYARA